MTNSFRQAPPLLMVCGLVVALLVLLVQGAFHKEGPLTFFSETQRSFVVDLGDGFLRPGAHQFSDALPLFSVIELTGAPLSENLFIDWGCPEKIVSGLSLNVTILREKVTQIHCGWMPAGRRMALGITLHPDRMSGTDWTSLPGVGPRLAERIENNRQENGDFVSLEAVQRVKGVGPKRISSWRLFFLNL